ncbi:MAG: amidohydrolase family protein [Dehalococcoidia bacterium]|nr:amidohydrolase family protein [Dehalococcoidia bacterium]
MAYDLLVKDGLVVDGSGMPAFYGDVGVKNGKIAEIGKLGSQADKVVDAQGLVVSPGFVDNHCHYDAQVTWDPLCTYSCYHGATTVIIGNCSLSLAPVRPGTEERLAEFLSYVEAIPMDVLQTVDFSWETTRQYMDTLDRRLGVNVGTLIGHSAIRHYVMGDECQGREATGDEIEAMASVLRDGMEAGALGLSISQNRAHYDPQGVLIPAIWANEEETFALGHVLQDLGTGMIQSGGGRFAEIKDRMMTRLSEATGRQVVYNNLSHSARKPNEWKELMAIVDETSKAGIRANPLCTPNSVTQTFTMKNCQVFRGVPTWHPILLSSDEAKMEAYRDHEVRRRLHSEVVEWQEELPDVNMARNWYDYMWVHQVVHDKNKSLQGMTIKQMAESQGKNIIDAFLDLVVEEELNTIFLHGELNVDFDACTQILNYPNSFVGLSDGGAHVQFHGGYGYSTRLLGYWVREKEIMPLENGVRKLTFDSASAFGIYDRGLLRPGMAADIAVFDRDTVRPLPEEVVYDFPAGGWRMQELAEGVKSTIVNGEILIDDGKPTGAMPGRVMRNALYNASHN